jgi:hypothetical protein
MAHGPSNSTKTFSVVADGDAALAEAGAACGDCSHPTSTSVARAMLVVATALLRKRARLFIGSFLLFLGVMKPFIDLLA